MKCDVIKMKGKMIPIMIIIAMIIGSFGAVGTNLDDEHDIDCNCCNNTINIDNKNYYLGEIENEDPLPNGIIFSGRSPSSLDWRNKDGHDWTTPIKNQGNCGSCYAFGSLAAVESCIKIKSDDPDLGIDLSEQFMVSCGKDWYSGMYGCDGAQPTDTHAFLDERGAIPESCFPYTSGSGAVPPCSDKCSDWQDKVIDIESAKISSSQDSIKNALNQYGPVSASFEVYQDFMDYTSGVYVHQSGGSLGWHRICIAGYNDNTGYWICKNSWGTSWGENGWFRIAYGECGIETKAYYVDPDYVGIEEEYQNGIEYDKDESSGDIKSWGSHGILMSDGSGQATAVFHINVGGDEVYEVGIEFADIAWFGNGPDLYVYNFQTSSWKKLASNMGNQDNLVWKWIATPNPSDYISSNGLVKIKVYAEADGFLSGDEVTLDEVGIKYKPKPLVPDLESEGSLRYGNVGSGQSKSASFKVKNVGDPGSKLSWKIESYPNWGEWDFNPSSGTGITPEQGTKTITVTVRAPNEPGDYTGKVIVINTANSNDKETISVSLTSSKSRTINVLFLNLIQNYPFLYQLLQQFLNVK